MNDFSAPPQPSPVVRIGFTGHRPNKLPAGSSTELRGVMRDVLTWIESAARAAPGGGRDTGLVLLSSLAEGSDRLAAEVALEQGWHLECVLPFSPGSYERDFQSDESKREFRHLLARARSVFVLDPARTSETEWADARAYEAAGLVMVGSSDLLVAVWDRQKPEGIGGTGSVVRSALADDIPVVLIPPAAGSVPDLYWQRLERMPLDVTWGEAALPTASSAETALPDAMRDLLSHPPTPPKRHGYETFRGERLPRLTLSAWYPSLLAIFGARAPRRQDVLPAAARDQNFARVIAQRPVEDKAMLAAAQDQVLTPAFLFADSIAQYYGERYRSAFVFNYLAAACAVALALSGLVWHDLKTGLVVAELVVIAAIVLNTLRGRAGAWHERWLDYRRLAEILRHMHFAAWLGSGGRIRRPDTSHGPAQQDWVDWYARLIRRQLPLPCAAADGTYLAQVGRYFVEGELRPQIAYHRDTAREMARADRVLHRAGIVCFSATGLACVAYLVALAALHPLEVGEEAKLLLTVATALLPTIGAALSAIRVQGDFENRAVRSGETRHRLLTIADAMAADQEGRPLSLALLSDRLDKAGLAMHSDLEEWRLLSETRPLGLPA